MTADVSAARQWLDRVEVAQDAHRRGGAPAVPRLTSALRAVLDLADELEHDARTDRDTVLWVIAALREAVAAAGEEGAR